MTSHVTIGSCCCSRETNAQHLYNLCPLRIIEVPYREGTITRAVGRPQQAYLSQKAKEHFLECNIISNTYFSQFQCRCRC